MKRSARAARRRGTQATAAALGGALMATGTVLAVAARRWTRGTAGAVERLHRVAAPHDGDVAPGAAGAYDPGRVAHLPAPVRRYLAFALTPGQRVVRRARVEHAGEFALEPGRWKPFTSVQEFTAVPPGFVWDARMALPPLPLAVRVRDSYVDGRGASRAAVAALVPVGGQAGTPEIAASALWRYLAESVWFPTALLPSERLTWTAVDDRTARATLTDRGARAVADFHFGPLGEVERVTGTRYRAVGDGQLPTPTEGRHRDYRRVGGMMIPTAGEVAWLLPEGPHVYWRARITRAAHDLDAGRVVVAGIRPGRHPANVPRDR